MKPISRAILLGVLLPNVALAHGQEIFFLPVGQGIALAATIIAGFLLRMSWTRRTLFLVLPILVMVITWDLPSSIQVAIMDILGPTEFGFVILGVLPPLTMAAAVYFICRKRANERDGA